jgi:hypothetical protein
MPYIINCSGFEYRAEKSATFAQAMSNFEQQIIKPNKLTYPLGIVVCKV